MSVARKCKIDGCHNIGQLNKNGRYYLHKGMCSKHYSRHLRYGDTEYVFTSSGIRKHPLYGLWSDIVQRCTNPKNNNYPNYGGRGITLCNRWRGSFEHFVSDIGDRPSPKHTIDRIDNNKGYSPDNCRWATRREQAINTRVRSDNKSGLKGVHYETQRSKWVAYINIEGKRKYIGRFDSKMHAIDARKTAEKKYWLLTS